MTTVTARQAPTRRQVEVLRAYIAAGSIAAAAHQLGITDSTARQHLSGLYGRTGCLNVAQAAYQLGRAEGEGRAGPTVTPGREYRSRIAANAPRRREPCRAS